MMKAIYEHAVKPILPVRFDENEWFTIAVTAVVLFFIHYISVQNRKLLWTEILCISLLNLQMTTFGDYFMAMPPYDFYDTVDRNSGELADIFLQNIVYPGTILFFMHFYRQFRHHKVLFIFICVFLLTAFEMISVYFFHLFTYKSWEIYFSFLFYLLIMVINVIFFEMLSRILKKRLDS